LKKGFVTTSIRLRRHRAPAAATLFALLALAVGASAQSTAWTAVGPEGGYVEALAVAEDGETLYAEAPSAGFFASQDGAETWRRTASSPPGTVAALAVDSGSASTVYAATTRGLFRSPDGGETWQSLNARIPGVNGCDPESAPCGRAIALLADPHQPGGLWASFDQAGLLFTSRDGGESWRRVLLGPSFLAVFAISAHPSEPGRLFLGTARGVYESRNGGAAWALTTRPSLPVTALAADAGPRGGLYISWSGMYGHFPCVYLGSRRRPTDDFTVPRDVAGTSINRCTPVHIAADPVRSGVALVALENGGLLKTVDGGRTWRWIRSAGPEILEVVQSRTHPGTLFARAEDHFHLLPTGISKSTDEGETWKPASRGIQAQPAAQIRIHSDGAISLLANGYRLVRSRDQGAHWKEVELPEPASEVFGATLDPTDPRALYLFSGSGIWRSPSGLPPWSRMGDRTTYTLAVDPILPGALYAADNADLDLPDWDLWVTFDFGRQWRHEPTRSRFNVSHLLAVRSSAPIGSTLLYAAGYPQGPESDSSSPYRLRVSTDRGRTWARLLDLPVHTGPFSAIAAELGSGAHLAVSYSVYEGGDPATTNGAVALSSDGGTHWRSSFLDPEHPLALALAIDPRDPNHLAAGSGRAGVFESRNGGDTWESLGGAAAGLPLAPVTSLAFDPSAPGRLYATLDGAGIYKIELVD
jgi:photosystem II stability/assembly factor-like uncharacterized protein